MIQKNDSASRKEFKKNNRSRAFENDLSKTLSDLAQYK